ncbi:MAG: helix-turn-helix domain-containing protein [Theionarchaea archaeon]|nr:helix-turn-helix domain-containing protein [Theionarchaea archaeon]
MISKLEITHMEKILQELGLGIYQSRALAYLYALGRSKAADIAKASGIPRSKIYSILKELSGLRLAKQIGTKPIQFEPIDPHTGIDNLKHARKIQFEKEMDTIRDFASTRLNLLTSVYNTSRNTETEEEFLEIITVGPASETETRKLYRKAQQEINVISRAFEYFPKVRDLLEQKIEDGVVFKVILLNASFLNHHDGIIQNRMRELLLSMGADVKISPHKLPIRFTLVDPSYEYDRGSVLFLVEEEAIPVFMRFAVLSDNHSLAAGFKQYFDLLWKESLDD